MFIYVNMDKDRMVQWILLVSVDVSVFCSPLAEMMEFHKDLEAHPCF